jgi:hypothetical protein
MNSPDECEHRLSQLEGRRCGTCGVDMVDHANAFLIHQLRERVSELEDTVGRVVDLQWGEPFDVGGSTRWECEPRPGWFASVQTKSSGEFRWADYIVTGPEDLRVEGEALDADKARVVVAKICEALR